MIEPTREDVDGMAGPIVLEFGASWCPHCQAIQSHLARSLAEYPQVQHLAIEDGKGKPLGRSFRVKLWPTLIFMRDGAVIARLVRPSPREIDEAFRAISREKPPSH